MPITLRPFNYFDHESLFRYANNPNIEKSLDDGFPVPYTREDAQNWVEFTMREIPRMILAIDLNGEAIGSIGLHKQYNILRRNLEMGYWIGEPHWGNGYAPRAIKLMTAYGFETFPEVDRIFARPFGTNIGSQRALEKAGYTFEARLPRTIWKHGHWEDELIYATRR